MVIYQSQVNGQNLLQCGCQHCVMQGSNICSSRNEVLLFHIQCTFTHRPGGHHSVTVQCRC